MTISIDTLKELLADAERARENLASRVDQLQAELADLLDEERAFKAALARRLRDTEEAVEADAQDDTPRIVAKDLHLAWTSIPRTEAVEATLRDLNGSGGPAGPTEIEALLRVRGRDDNRDAISGALAHLARTARAHRVGRAKWAPGPSETPGSAADTALPGPVATEWAGGDADAAPTAAEPNDHDQTPGRDHRDHYRVANGAVAVDS